MVTIAYDDARVADHLDDECGFGTGNGAALAEYFLDRTDTANIEAFPEELLKDDNESNQPQRRLGSIRAFTDLREKMNAGDDVLVFVHGFNVSWWEAVASATSLQCMLNRHCNSAQTSPGLKPVHVVLFTWPSDGLTIPYWSYFSDRSDAKISGYALGRGLLKLRDYLMDAQRLSRRKGEPPCGRSVHLLCHSMGNFVLQNAVERTADFSVGGKLPCIFDQIFLCAADVATDVFQPGQPFHTLPRLARAVAIYHNTGDLTMPVSAYTKGNTDRLGWNGAEKPADLPDRVQQLDCSRLVSGLLEHSYYQCGAINDDIRQSIDGIPADSPERNREAVWTGWRNVWRLVDE